MVHRGTLLSRLVAPVGSARPATVDTVGVAIGRVLVERRGNSPSSPECGVSDFSDLLLYSKVEAESQKPGGVDLLKHEIKAALCACEPRLAALEVEEDAPGKRHSIRRFRVTAELKEGPAQDYYLEVASPGVLEITSRDKD